MKLVVGLGNVSDRYEGTRHNLGFAVVDHFLSEVARGASPDRKFSSDFWDLRLPSGRVLIQKPSTYMNLSGVAVRECATFFKVPPEDWIVVHDELDLDPAVLRLKKGGGTAGHRGLESILAETGASDFWRVRIGIGKRKPIEKYVLERIPAAERDAFAETVGRAASAVSFLVRDEHTQAMNTFNTRERGPGSSKE